MSIGEESSSSEDEFHKINKQLAGLFKAQVKLPLHLACKQNLKKVKCKIDATRNEPTKKQRQKTKNQETDDNHQSDSGSDYELPREQRHVIPQLKDNEYLRMFQGKNPMHDCDREKASSIISNLILPTKQQLQANPYLNKSKLEEPNFELSDDQLKDMSQLPDSINNLKLSKSNANKNIEFKSRNLIMGALNLKQIKNGASSSINRLKSQVPQETINDDLKGIYCDQKNMTAYPTLDKQQNKTYMTSKKDQSQSQLTEEIRQFSKHKLSRQFILKLREYEKFRKQNKLHEFNLNSLQLKDKLYRYKNQMDGFQGNEDNAKEENSFKKLKCSDKLLRFQQDIPVYLKDKARNKFCIQERDISPIFHQKEETPEMDVGKLFHIGEYLKESKSSYQKNYNFNGYDSLGAKKGFNHIKSQKTFSTKDSDSEYCMFNLPTINDKGEKSTKAQETSQNFKQSESTLRLNKILKKSKRLIDVDGKNNISQMLQSLEDLQDKQDQIAIDIEEDLFKTPNKLQSQKNRLNQTIIMQPTQGRDQSINDDDYRAQFKRKQEIWVINSMKSIESKYQQINYRAIQLDSLKKHNQIRPIQISKLKSNKI
ncbi:UNKNOWN [Stylonychia lemnae]|uniref:Uncharacterized protein n=1 Tax=Stylonychia lemnae TaxID=5949 RepID=A0A078A754_STYLE|nr:UNKNOWN [Stylonychia lemnae]|eukprot:CDW76621.1 UNKNOWN [Stylonychia lemnae]